MVSGVESTSHAVKKRPETFWVGKSEVNRTTFRGLSRGSRGLERVELEDIVIGGRAEVKRLCGSRTAVIAWALEAQRALKVQELAHEVEVGGNVRFLHLHDVIGVVHGEVELLHQVGDGHRDGTANSCQAVNEDAAFLTSGFI